MLEALTAIGTAAMLWVGGGIIVHGLHEFHVDAIPAMVERLAHAASSVPMIGTATGWAAGAGAAAVVGAVVGGVIAGLLHLVHAMRGKH